MPATTRKPITPARGLRHAAAILVMGLILSPVTAFFFASLADSPLLNFPGTRLTHSFGTVERAGVHWAVVVMGPAFASEVFARPFADAAAAHEQVARDIRVMEKVIRLQTGPGGSIDDSIPSRISSNFALPSWETATHTSVPPNAAPGTDLSYASTRALGFPMRFVTSTSTSIPTSGRRPTISVYDRVNLGPISIPSRIIWSGLLVNVLTWGLITWPVALGARALVRRLRRPRAEAPAAS